MVNWDSAIINRSNMYKTPIMYGVHCQSDQSVSFRFILISQFYVLYIKRTQYVQLLVVMENYCKESQKHCDET